MVSISSYDPVLHRERSPQNELLKYSKFHYRPSYHASIVDQLQKCRHNHPCSTDRLLELFGIVDGTKDIVYGLALRLFLYKNGKITQYKIQHIIH